MKKLLSIFLLALTVGFYACDDDQALANGYVEPTQEGSVTYVMKGYEDAKLGYSVLKPEGFKSPMYLQEKQFTGKAYSFVQTASQRLDELTTADVNAAWESQAAVAEGAAYWARFNAGSEYRFMKFRVADVDGNNVYLEYVVTDQVEVIPNANANDASENQSVGRLEMPRLNAKNVYADHYVDYNGNKIMNLALEWCPTLNHANWVAFTFDKVTCQDNVKRTNAWSVDPKLPKEMQTDDNDHKSDGFDKGHLCASEDRVYCEEANEQTFFFSNMSPQVNQFNGGVWQKLEAKVQSWGRSCTNNTYDIVYVAKGGTMNNLLINYDGEGKKGSDGHYPTTDADGKTVHGLASPKYYFMAVMTEKDGKYNAIGFLLEHKIGHPSNPTIEQMQAYAVSIDELEEKTGLDFFCNLKDGVENEVEANLDLKAWAW